jgi:hypothetical protein
VSYESGDVLEEEFHRNGELRLLLLCYSQALLAQMAQTAVCNRRGDVGGPGRRLGSSVRNHFRQDAATSAVDSPNPAGQARAA